MIWYSDSATDLTVEDLRGFFVGWPNPPAPAAHLRLLNGSSHIVLARDGEAGVSGRVVGFITAVSDGVISAYIPLLEVLPEYQERGIGSELVRRLLAKLADYYMIDLLCDADIQTYYERFGMRRASGMMLRHYDRQSGRPEGGQQ